jgi:hypothetical protein
MEEFLRSFFLDSLIKVAMVSQKLKIKNKK